MANPDTREAWLERAIDALRPTFETAGYPLPKRIHVSVGFPSRGGLRGTHGVTLGQCWGSNAGCDVSTDKAPHIFISPLHTDPVAVLDTLVHELAHAAAPSGAKHGAKFVKVCNAVGLTEDKPKSRRAGAALIAELARLNVELGDWPHAALDARGLPKAQAARLVKVSCEACGYTCRVARVWLDGPGAPICPQDEQPMQEA